MKNKFLLFFKIQIEILYKKNECKGQLITKPLTIHNIYLLCSVLSLFILLSNTAFANLSQLRLRTIQE